MIDQSVRDAVASFMGDAPKKLLIGGQWRDSTSGKTLDCINPANGQVVAKIAAGNREDVNAAVAAARRAFDGPWSKVKPFERQSLLLRLADLVDKNFEELSLIDTINMGAPLSRTLGNRRHIVGRLRYYAGLATSMHGETIPNSMPGELLSYTLKEPIGVVAGITPWNGPMMTAVWKLGPAIATGCTIVLKPAEWASLSAIRLGELALEAGFPEGVVNIITGVGSEVGAALAEHPDVDKISFTGSTGVGQSLVRASAGNLKRLSLELGGKSPDIVFADADLDAAVPGAAMAVFAGSGQICSAGTRLFVERSIYGEFVERVARFSETLKVGNGLDPETQLGPIVSARQLERICGYLEAGRNEGATLSAGGNRIEREGMDKGYFVAPTVFSDVEDDMTIAREEIFGPVIAALPFDHIDEVVKRANNTMYGLGSGVWTRDINKAHHLSKHIRAGSVWINCYQAMDPAVPFGGYKMSGYGRESGLQHLEEFLNVKSVWIKTA